MYSFVPNIRFNNIYRVIRRQKNANKIIQEEEILPKLEDRIWMKNASHKVPDYIEGNVIRQRGNILINAEAKEIYANALNQKRQKDGQITVTV